MPKRKRVDEVIGNTNTDSDSSAENMLNNPDHNKKTKNSISMQPFILTSVVVENNIPLITTRSRNGGHLINIYADETGSIKATYTREGVTEHAFFVKGINSKIDVGNIELLAWVKTILSTNCYFLVSRGDVHVNVRILGGGDWTRSQFFLVVFGGIFAGAALISLGSGLGPTIGSNLVKGCLKAAGVSTITAVFPDKEDCQVNNGKKELIPELYFKNRGFGRFAKQALAGGATGAVSELACSKFAPYIDKAARETANSAAYLQRWSPFRCLPETLEGIEKCAHGGFTGVAGGVVSRLGGKLVNTLKDNSKKTNGNENVNNNKKETGRLSLANVCTSAAEVGIDLCASSAAGLISGVIK